MKGAEARLEKVKKLMGGVWKLSKSSHQRRSEIRDSYQIKIYC